MLTVRSTINIAGQAVPNIIPAVQGDTGRSIEFTLADFTIPAGSTATYYVQKPSGEAVYNSATIDGNKVTVELTAQSLAETGDNYGQVRILNDEDVVTSFDFILLVKPFRGIEAIESTTEMNIFDKAVQNAMSNIDGMLPNIIAPVFSTSTAYTAGDYVIYSGKLYQFTASHSGAWTGTDAEETTVSEDITALKEDISHIGGLSEDIKQAMLQIASKVAYIDEDGQDYYDALEDALYPSAKLVRISAVYTQSGTVYDTDSLDSLKADLVVTAHMSDYTTRIVTTYTLSGTLAEGTSTVTVVYGGKTTTFNVTVTQLLPTGYTKLAYVTTNGNQYVSTGISETQAAKAEYEVMITAQPKVNGNHILSSTNVYFPFLKGGSASDSDWQINCGAMNKGGQTFEISDVSGVTAYAWEMNRKYKLSGLPDIYIDGVFVDRLPEGSTASASNMLTLFAYGGNTGKTDYRFHGNLYWCKIYDSNNNLLRNFVPAKNSSNVAGLYDTVSETFFTSATSSALIAGEVG